MATGALTSEMTFNTHMKLSWGLVHLGYNTPEKYGCFNTATYKDVVDKSGKPMQDEYSRLADVCVDELGLMPKSEINI